MPLLLRKNISLSETVVKTEHYVVSVKVKTKRISLYTVNFNMFVAYKSYMSYETKITVKLHCKTRFETYC